MLRALLADWLVCGHWTLRRARSFCFPGCRGGFVTRYDVKRRVRVARQFALRHRASRRDAWRILREPSLNAL